MNTSLLANLHLPISFSILQEKNFPKGPAAKPIQPARPTAQGSGLLATPSTQSASGAAGGAEWTKQLGAQSPCGPSCSADTRALTPLHRWSTVSGQSACVTSKPHCQTCHTAPSLKIRVAWSSFCCALYKILKCYLLNTNIPLMHSISFHRQTSSFGGIPICILGITFYRQTRQRHGVSILPWKVVYDMAV